MKAIVCTKYDSPSVLQRKKTKKATPKGNEVFIKVYAASANAADWRLLSGDRPHNGIGCARHNYETDRFGSVSFV